MLAVALAMVAMPGFAAALPANLDLLRGGRAQSLAARTALQREQGALEPALTTIGVAISARKALGQETADEALETLLRRHREVSERLTELSQALRVNASQVLQATQALIDGIDREVVRLRRDARGRSAKARDARRVLRALLAERGTFAVGPVGGGCALPEVELSAADGPEEATAKVNLLRDAEERCRRRIRKVEARLSQLRDERKLLQEAADFRDEGEIFDEESRRRTQVRTQLPPALVPTTQDRAGGGVTAGTTAGAPAPAGTFGGAAGTPTGPAVNGDTRADAESHTTPPAPVFLRQSQVDSTLGGSRHDTPDGEIADLTQQRGELERAALRIKKAHEALQKRARPLR